MPVLRVGDAQEREDVGRLPEMAMRVVRGVEDRLVRRQRRQARGVPGMAPLEGEAGGHARAGAHVQEARRRLLADLAHAGADGLLRCNKKWSRGTAVGILDQSGTGGEPHVQPGAEEARDRDFHQIRP